MPATGGNSEPLAFRRPFGKAAIEATATVQAIARSFTMPPPPPPPPAQQAVSKTSLEAPMYHGAGFETFGPPPPPPPAPSATHSLDEDRRSKDVGNRSKDHRDFDKDGDKDRHRSSRDHGDKKSDDRSEKSRWDKDRSRSDRDRDRRRSRSREREHRSSRRSRSRSPDRSHDYDRSDGRDLGGGMYGPKLPPDANAGTAAASKMHSGPPNHSAFGSPSSGQFSAAMTGSPAPGSNENSQDGMPAAADGSKRQRKSRWSKQEERAFIPGMPTMLPSNLTDEQQRAYLLQLQIEDITRRLRCGDLGAAANDERTTQTRSPSPEPVYDHRGQRQNTREVRTRQKLEKQRHEAIQELLKINPHYKAPADYKAPIIKLHEKVWIPQDEHPEINFVGLLIGPRGNTLKQLEIETGAKIIIRGKGSVKEGKIIKRDGPLPGENEPLHAYITATTQECIDKAVVKIKEIIEQGTFVPEADNELRKNQLRELALLNGTLRVDDLLNGPRCGNCGAVTHKTWECPDRPNVTHTIICTVCGCMGHLARDCKSRPPGVSIPGASGPPPVALDDEYSALMEELGQGSGKPKSVFSSNKRESSLTNFAMEQDRSSMKQQPLIKLNLAEQFNQRMQPPPAAAFPPMMPYPSMMPPYWGDPYAAAAGGAGGGLMAPPPPPPPGSTEADSGYDAGGLPSFLSGALAPPPPPPSIEVNDLFSGLLNAVPPPPPPP